MSANPLPSDSSSLLVPLNLDAWVVDSSTQEGLAWYYANYANLANFESPMPEAFDVSDASQPPIGVHLHWALPDALTHARQSGTKPALDSFPLVPNRWLIARFNSSLQAPWQCTLWVVQSDYLGSAIGTTSADLNGSGISSITLAAGASQAIGAGVALQVVSSGTSVIVTTAAPVAAGSTQISIQTADFASDLPTGSTVSLVATSAFLDPFDPSYMTVTPEQSTSFTVNAASIGTNYTIEQWNAIGDPGTGQFFLQAVGPANVSFAAYVPSVQDVFSFVDTTVPASPGLYYFTYLVTGWYSDPQSADPLRGVNAFDPAHWASEQDWQSQTPAQRFEKILHALKWSINGAPPAIPPSTSLYHSLAVDVQWPYTTLGNSSIEQTAVRVAVGNTSIDALAALIQAEAQSQSKSDPTDANAWLAAGQTLAQLVQAAMYDLLDDYGKPGGSVMVEQQIEQAWFGSDPGGTRWEVVSAPTQAAGAQVQPPNLTTAQTQAVGQNLAALNQGQTKLDADLRQLQWLQANLYMMWWRIGRANSFPWGETPTTTPAWNVLQPFMETTIYPALFSQVWDQFCTVSQEANALPNPTDITAANIWANQNWTFPGNGSGTLHLSDLGLQLKPNAGPRFWHPNDPVLLIAGVQRAQKHGEDGRYNADGTLSCRLPNQVITGIQISGQPAINQQTLTQTLTNAGINLNPCLSYASVPAIPSLLAEAFLADPLNAAPAIATAANIPEGPIQQTITNLVWNLSAPSSACIAAAGSADSNGPSGSYQFYVTYADSGGAAESNPGPASAAVSLTAQDVILTSIPVSTDARVGKRNIYATGGTLSQGYLVGTIDDNTTTLAVFNSTDLAANSGAVLLAAWNDKSATQSGVVMSTATWSGTPPVPFAIEMWEQAWSPLFLEWELQYFPTGDGEFSLSDWQFDGTQYIWAGTGFYQKYLASYKGRTLLTPQAPLLFKDKIAALLKHNANVDSQQLESLISTVSNWDLLSQSLSGLTDQLITLDSQETFPPPQATSASVTCPSAPGAVQPQLAELIGGQYHYIPVLESTGDNFYPIRGGFVQFQQIQVVDAFGQTYSVSSSNSGQGFQPILGQGLMPTITPSGFPDGMVQLPPRLVQSSRLDMQWLANDGSGQDITVSSNANAICGWLLPNHLDGGIAVYDSSGVLLGELWPLPLPYNWRPRPGDPGSNPPPLTPADIPNAVLQQVVTSLAAQTADVFNDFLNTVDETLWMIDPLGGRKDQFLSVLIGRPLAVVQMQLALNLNGSPWFNQTWNDMLATNPQTQQYQWAQDSGDLEQVSFPVRLGSLDLRDDGLIGYYLSDGTSPYSKFYSVNFPEHISSGDTYIQQIFATPNGSPQYSGNVFLTPQTNTVTLTMILDPRGSVHAYTGLLPVTTAALPGHAVEEFIKTLKVTFQTGPIIADPGTLRIPQPAEQHGAWNWIQLVASAWEQDTIIDADDQARLPDGNLQLREGWLQLTGVQD